VAEGTEFFLSKKLNSKLKKTFIRIGLEYSDTIMDAWRVYMCVYGAQQDAFCDEAF